MEESKATVEFNRELYAATIETIQDGVFVLKDEKFVLVNQAFVDMLGTTKSNILGHLFLDWIAPESKELLRSRNLSRLNEDSVPSEYEFGVLNAVGERLTVQLKSNAFKASDGCVYVVSSIRDITLQKKLTEQVRASEKELRQIIVNMPGIFYRTDAVGTVIMASPYSIEILGYDEHEVIGQPLAQFYAEPHQRTEVLTKILQGQGKPVEVESLLRRRDGSTIWVATSAFARFDKNGSFTGVEGISRNITDRKNLEAKLRDMAVKDQLTSLLNRFGLQEHLEAALNRAKRQHNHVSIIYIDLDDFKSVNDLYGHQMGDKYLVEFAQSLQKSFRETDLCARIGGDEFVILLDDNTVGDSIKGLLSRLNRLMNRPLFIENTELNFEYSLGIATFPKHAATASELLNYADQQMYLSKKAECES